MSQQDEPQTIARPTLADLHAAIITAAEDIDSFTRPGHVSEYPMAIAVVQVHIDNLWKKHFDAEESENLRKAALKDAVYGDPQYKNNTQRDAALQQVLADDIPYARHKTDRVHTKTQINQWTTVREYLIREYDVLMKASPGPRHHLPNLLGEFGGNLPI